MPEYKDILKKAKNIAVVRTDRIGDIILTMPMLKPLKAAAPDAELTVIARKYTKDILDASQFDFKKLYIDDNDAGIADIFRKEKFDAAFFPRPRLNECFEAFKNRVKLRVGSGYRLYSIFLNKRIYEHRKKGRKHEAEYNTGLVEAVAGEKFITQLLPVKPSGAAIASLEQKLSKLKESLRNESIIIHPGSRGSAIDWPIEMFAEAAKILEKQDIQIIITGVDSEYDSCLQVERKCSNSLNLCGLLNLEELIALIYKVKILASNSTGVIHIAAAAGISTIGLYPNTRHISHLRWGPYSDNSIILNPPCEPEEEKDNMNRIEINSFVDSALRLLGR